MKTINNFLQESPKINDNCVLFTGVSTAGKTTISYKLAKKLHLKKVIELDEVMRRLVLKKHPKLKSFYKNDLIEYFGTIEKAKQEMLDHQLPALTQTISKYRKLPVLIEGIMYYPESYNLIDNLDCKIYVINPISPKDHLNNMIYITKKDNYNLNSEDRKSIIENYKKSIEILKKFINRYKDRIVLIENKIV